MKLCNIYKINIMKNKKKMILNVFMDKQKNKKKKQ